MVEVVKHREILERLGIAKLSDVKRFQGNLVKNHRGHRDIFVIETADARGKSVVLYLKRNLKPYKKDGLSSVFRNGRVWSSSRQEWENSQRLAKAGIKTAPLVAYGEECGILWERYSFLITEKAPGNQSLLEFLSSSNDPDLRQRVLKELAILVRRLHLSGLATPDLFCRHVFVNLASPTLDLCFIDMARLDHIHSVPKRVLARDLAALYVSAPMEILNVRERLRFLHAYSKTRVLDRDLVKLIRRRVCHLLKRRKYRRILLGEN
jgi:Lipopolysaccharide kinase (Kdo/WaaP) family